jgi:hypothetical protein
VLTRENKCADITFKADAKPLAGDACKSNGVTFAAVKEQKAANQTTSAGAIAGTNPVVLSAVVGLTLLFATGMSL